MWEEQKKHLHKIGALIGFVAFTGIFFETSVGEKASIASLRLVYDNAAGVVNIGASMAPNEYNTFAQELQKRADELSAREREIALREDALNSGSILSSSSSERLLFLMGGMILLLLLLILINFYLDWRRGKLIEGNSDTHETGDAVHETPHATHEGELTTRL